jgi:hypothetical protein
MKKNTIKQLLFLLFIATNVHAISVSEAYNAIPHRQQTYRASLSNIAQADREYLEKFFQLTDKALILRIESIQTFQKHQYLNSIHFNERYAELKKDFAQFDGAGWKSQAKDLILSALDHQQKYLSTFDEFTRKSGQAEGYHSNPDVAASSQALQQLYGLFMSQFSNESSQNKDAFFQHLCALDFV